MRVGALQRFERQAPNELWQMDFKGPLCPAERVGPLSVLDDHSRYLLVLQTVANTSAGLVREHLQAAFGECGVPEGMLMDHGIRGERAVAAGFYPVIVVADEARDRAALGADTAPANARQSGALSWRIAAGIAISAAASGPAGVAG